MLRGAVAGKQSCVRGQSASIKSYTLPGGVQVYETFENFTSAHMPLLQQDDARESGNSNASRRSIADFLGLETAHQGEPAAASAIYDRHIEYGDANTSRWEMPSSPEAAQSPRALVPANCFPPRQPTAFASFSENAHPGAMWSDESTSARGITDLVASLALATPSGSNTNSMPPARFDNEVARRRERAGTRDRSALLPRRASFCGVITNGRNGGEMVSWGGKLPPRCTDPSGGYSPKVFLGGLPWDITEHALMHALKHFQPIRVEWPGRDSATGACGGGAPRGYAYVTFESERRVRALLAASRRDGNDWYYRICSRKTRTKEVQVIPWALSDSHWVLGGSVRLEPTRTVFVGALHGMLCASALAAIMNDLFSGVVYAGIDTDKYKYPIGSGRVTFSNIRSYIRAISAAYIEIHTDKFTKKVQINPYLEDAMCSVCNLQQGPYFCREPTCFGYFCRTCWSWQHAIDAHQPLTRSSARHSVQENHDNQPVLNGNYFQLLDNAVPPPSGSSDAGSASDESRVIPWPN